MTKPTNLSRAALIAGAALTLGLGACASTMNDDPPSMSLTQSNSARTSGAATSSSSGAHTAHGTTSATHTSQAEPATPPAEPAAAPSTNATAGATVEYTDAQLRSFVAASTAIRAAQPADGAQPTPDQVAQIRAALETNGLDRDSYNAIAQRMRTDAAFNTRIEALRTASGGASAAATTTPPSN